MKLRLIMAGVLLAVSGANPSAPHGSAGAPRASQGPGFSLGAVEPPPVEVRSGEPAPDFSYQSPDGRWRHLHDLLQQGEVVLVFGASDLELRMLERERDALLDLGVMPVAVLDVKPGSAWNSARKLGLRYTVLADPRRIIGAQFNVLDSGSLVPGWFVIDRKGMVRGLRRGDLPGQGYPGLVARALSLPLPSVPLPVSH